MEIYVVSPYIHVEFFLRFFACLCELIYINRRTQKMYNKTIYI